MSNEHLSINNAKMKEYAEKQIAAATSIKKESNTLNTLLNVEYVEGGAKYLEDLRNIHKTNLSIAEDCESKIKKSMNRFIEFADEADKKMSTM
jgi:hypothetical protein